MSDRLAAWLIVLMIGGGIMGFLGTGLAHLSDSLKWNRACWWISGVGFAVTGLAVAAGILFTFVVALAAALG